MTITVQTPRNTYIADGVQDTFSFDFRILENSDLRVLVDSVLQQESVHYNLTNITELGGNVVFIVIPVLNAEVSLVRSTSESQQVVYTPFDPFPAKTHEAALDKLTMLIQELFLATGDIQPGQGLPLDPTGIFWDSGSKQIRNTSNPVNGQDVATKEYVDLGDAGAGNGFDPSADETITGSWTFDNIILGIASGNLVPADLNDYTRRNIAETITALWLVNDGAGSARKIAARNPRERAVIVNDVPTQADEGAILRVTGPISNITLEQLEAQTTFTIFAKQSGYSLLAGAGVNINLYDGLGLTPPIGDRLILRASAVQVQYESPTEVTIYGTGIGVAI